MKIATLKTPSANTSRAKEHGILNSFRFPL